MVQTRTAARFVLLLTMLVLTAVGFAGPAQACSNTSSCYGRAK